MRPRLHIVLSFLFLALALVLLIYLFSSGSNSSIGENLQVDRAGRSLTSAEQKRVEELRRRSKESMVYMSQAKILVPWIIERSSTADVESESSERFKKQVIGPILEMLRSVQLAVEVADTVGPEKLIGDGRTGNGGFKDVRSEAAEVIRENLRVMTPGGQQSGLIELRFTHASQAVPQVVLKTILERCIQMNLRKRRLAGSGGRSKEQWTADLESEDAGIKELASKALRDIAIQDAAMLFAPTIENIKILQKPTKARRVARL